MPWRRWGIPDEVGWLAVLLALAVGPVFLVAGFTTVEWVASSNYSYQPGQGEFQPFPTPVLPPVGSAIHFEIDVEGNGQVILTPGGPCRSESRCSYELPSGIEVTLAAIPGADSAFVGWEGDCRGLGAEPVATLVAEARRRCLARFTPSVQPPAAGSTAPIAVPGTSTPAASSPTATPTPMAEPPATRTPRVTFTPAPTPTAGAPLATPLPTSVSATAEPRAELRPEGCSLESTLRSADGSVVTSIELTNGSSRLLKNPDLAKNGRTLRYENWDDFGPSTPFSAPC